MCSSSAWFHCWHCLHKIPSREWVICSSSAWFLLLTLTVWTSIQKVSHVQLLCLIYIANIVCTTSIQIVSYMQPIYLIYIDDIMCMNFHPASSEWCAAPLLDLHCWHCLHELQSSLWEPCAALLCDFHCWYCLHELLCRKWAICSSFAWFLLLILLAWTPIQKVSHVQLLCLMSIAHIACSHCLHGLLSSLWVAVQLLCLMSIAHIACMGSHPASEWLCSSSVWCLLLTLPAWGPIQIVSCCAAPLLDIYCSHCLHGVPSRSWVAVQLLCLISIAHIACMGSHPASELLCSSSAWYLLLTLPA